MPILIQRQNPSCSQTAITGKSQRAARTTIADGADWKATRDSELVAHLIDRQLKKMPDLLKAVPAGAAAIDGSLRDCRGE